MNDIIGYRFIPLTKNDFKGMQVAWAASCPISRRITTTRGGGRDIFHPSVVKLLLNDKTTKELVRMRLLEVEAEVATLKAIGGDDEIK